LSYMPDLTPYRLPAAHPVLTTLQFGAPALPLSLTQVYMKRRKGTGLRRPPGWAPNTTSAAFLDAKVHYEQFARRLLAIRQNASLLNTTNTVTTRRGTEERFGATTTSPNASNDVFVAWSKGDQADWWALSSAVARQFYELYILRSQTRDATYYVQQGPGAVWDSLVRHDTHNSKIIGVGVRLAACGCRTYVPSHSFTTSRERFHSSSLVQSCLLGNCAQSCPVLDVGAVPRALRMVISRY